MKKLLLPVFLLISAMSFGQSIFSEDFEGTTGNALPTGWAQYNVDGHTVASSIPFGNNAWITYGLQGDSHGQVALATSWYNPAAQSDDWLVTPAIALVAGQSYALSFEYFAPDATYPDNYEVWVSTTGNTVNDFTANGTQLFATTSEGEWKTKKIDLSAYAGQSVYIAFRDVANDMDVLAIDNVKVLQLQPDNATLDGVTHNRLSLENVDNSIVYHVTNSGSTAITSLKVKYSDGTTDVEETVNTNIPVGQSGNVTLSNKLNYPNIVEKNFTHDIELVNGNTDPDVSDNEAITKFNTITENYTRNVVIEEGTGTWCGWCPRGFEAMEYMEGKYPDRFIGIAVHNQDPMTVSAYDNGAGFSAFPGCNVDRVILGGDVDPSTFEQYYNQRKDVPTMGKVSADISSAGNDLTIVAHAQFNTKISNNQLRLAVVLKENNVTGTGSGYNQNNYYAGGSYGSTTASKIGDFANLPSSVPAAQMIYDNVGRVLLGGYNGQTNSVPANVTETTTADYTFTYTIASAYKKNDMKAVILLIDNSTGEIVNAAEYDLAVASTKTVDDMNALSVYPNPAKTQLNISLDKTVGDYTVSITDLSGKLLKKQDFKGNTGVQSASMNVSDLAKGSYLVTVSTSTESYKKHFIVE